MVRGFVAAVVAGLAFGAAPAHAVAGDWPVYGHDLANTRDAGADGPSAAAAGSLQQTWKFSSSQGDFTGTPVVAGGVVVAATNMGSVYALQASTGRLLWSQDLGQPVNGSAAIDRAAPGGPAVFVPIAQQGDPQLAALSLANGRLRWRVPLSRQPSNANADVFGSPTFWRGTVYIGTSGPNGDGSTARGSVVALNESTGAVRWISYTVPPGHDGGAVWATPAIDTRTGRLYVGTGNAYHAPAADTTDAVLAMSATSGRILAHFQATPDDTFASDNPLGPDADFGASPNLLRAANGTLLVGEGQKSGTYWAFGARSLHPVWHTSVGPSSEVGGIIGSTAYDGGRIYGTDAEDGQVWALANGGAQAWNSIDPSAADFAPVAVANGVLYTVDPAGFLVTRNAATGTPLTALPLGSPSFGGVSVAGGRVFAAVGTGPPPGGSDGSSGSILAFAPAGSSALSQLPAVQGLLGR
jgi:polyvinyl alcohol dehydrogenase (cytochrome)